MKTKMKCNLFVVLAGLCLSMGSVQAMITVSTLTDDESLIVNTGFGVVSAVNFGSVAGGNTTVDINGISHAVSSTNNGSSLDLVAGDVSGNFTFIGRFRDGAAGSAGLSGDLRNLVGGIGGAPSMDFDVFGLTPGVEYLFQAYFEASENAGRVASLPELQITFEGTDSETFNNQLQTAFLISYRFTATDATLDVQFDEFNAPSATNVWLSGYSLQAVPEPSSVLLLGLGSLALVARRKRD